MSFKNKTLKILDYRVPEDAPYIILETYSKLCNKSRIMHVIHFTTAKDVKIGRGHESNIRVTDISVSWIHAVIEHHQNKFYLWDENSKFGTLMGLDRPRHLLQHHSVQNRNSVIEIELKGIPTGICGPWKQKIEEFGRPYAYVADKFP